MAALVSFASMLGDTPEQRSTLSTAWTWLTAGQLPTSASRSCVDPLSVLMMLIVSGVGSLIVAYSIGYMDGDDEERRYFAYMALFVFSMLLLVQGGNLLMLLVGWGLVGLSSYLLIGFEHERPAAIAAAKKAFIMNAFGDATMALALFLLIQQHGVARLRASSSRRRTGSAAARATNLSRSACSAARSRSRRSSRSTPGFPDAMEGPTPVSALIHAATMVTAGVYLIVRTHAALRAGAARAQDLAAGLGAVTLARSPG